MHMGGGSERARKREIFTISYKENHEPIINTKLQWFGTGKDRSMDKNDFLQVKNEHRNFNDLWSYGRRILSSRSA